MDIGLGLASLLVVLALLDLVAQGILGGSGASNVVSWMIAYTQRLMQDLPSALRGVAVLGDLLVGLLGSARGGLLDLLADEVRSLLDGVHYDV